MQVVNSFSKVTRLILFFANLFKVNKRLLDTFSLI